MELFNVDLHVKSIYMSIAHVHDVHGYQFSWTAVHQVEEQEN